MPETKHNLSWKRQPKLVSNWPDGLLLACPLPEYPRPQFVRKDWLNLNGEVICQVGLLITFDRKVVKVDATALREINHLFSKP